MSQLGVLFLSCFLAGFLPSVCFGATAKEPDVREVYGIIESNLPAGMSGAEVNRIALKGMLTALHPRVLLEASTDASDNSGKPAPAVIKTDVFDKSIAYIRVENIDRKLSPELVENLKRLGSTNKIQGIVLDLRFAGGSDYQAAGSAADLFVSSEKPLLDWGSGAVIATKGSVMDVPTAVLVNGKTAGAAEALAAALRDAGAGLVLGSKTAGLAAGGKEFALSNGQKLRINLSPVKVGSGAVISPEGLAPDITVEVSPEEERLYYADPFAVLSRTNGPEGAITQSIPAGTNRVSRRIRLNEAELVREHNEGRSGLSERFSADPEQQTVGDPALARAMDVLKGLAVVRQRN
jgi:hypothetical protein